MQLRLATDLDVHDYVIRDGGRDATLDACPNHPGGGCKLHRHGFYERKTQHGWARIRRWRCVESGVTFSLLPDCFAARMPGSLMAAEETARRVEAGEKPLEAALAVRGRRALELSGMRRWARRRCEKVRLALLAATTMFPGLLPVPLVEPARRHLGAACALVELRRRCDADLQSLRPPLGFRPP